MNLKEKTYLGYVVLLRLWIGYYLLQQGVNKYLRDFPHRDWFSRQIGNLADLNVFPWYKSFLQNAVFPNQEIFGYLVMTGEILVGLCLVLGLLTRFSAIVGLFMMINYLLGPGMARGGASLAQQQTFIVSLLVIALSNPGRTLGVDGLLFGRR
ncbi:MAG: DoxX family membrane protein [Candidatus Binatia bacterium]